VYLPKNPGITRFTQNGSGHWIFTIAAPAWWWLGEFM